MENIETVDEVQEIVESAESQHSAIPPETKIYDDFVEPAQIKSQSCPTCSGQNSVKTTQYIYTLGRIQPRFPSVGIEKEYIQAAARRKKTAGQTDSEVMADVLSDPQNRYLARKLCWVLNIEGLETYILQPMNNTDLELVIESLRPSPSPLDLSVVIGVMGPIAPPSLCNGMQLPILGYDQIYSFDVATLIKSIPKPAKISAKEFAPAAEELFMRIIQISDNAGATDDHRALNYVSVRYNAIYAIAAECYSRDCSFTSIEVIQSRLYGLRKIVDVVLAFTGRSTDVTEKYFCRVDVTEEFPFLVTKMQPYFDR